MVFWNKICGVIAIFLIFPCISQAQTAKKEITVPQDNILKGKPTAHFTGNIYKLEVIPQNFYTQHFGFMCRKELSFEKATKIPFRFRLGSLQQCNYYEGKK